MFEGSYYYYYFLVLPRRKTKILLITVYELCKMEKKKNAFEYLLILQYDNVDNYHNYVIVI